MKISLIVAMANNRAIGLNNQMPWHLSADLKNFKKVTMGLPIIMGRKTFESIGRPLPGRLNIVISRNPDYLAQGCQVFTSLDDGLAYASQHAQEAFVIGGAALYQAAFPLASQLYLTAIGQDFPGDTFFPEFSGNEWQEAAREDINDDPSVPFSYSFIQLKRRILPV
ncbi:type 3 dihydrofolate reductase [Methylosoma difficile]